MFIVVYHSCYDHLMRDPYRIYRSDDPYLDENPNMWTLESEFNSFVEAEAFKEELTEQKLVEDSITLQRIHHEDQFARLFG